jgi:membrane-associated protease RseP (regulator of RpoE activity)
LLVLTAASLAVAGGFFWEGAGAELRSAWELFDPRFLARCAARGWPYAAWVIAILGSHEMGHWLACRYYGIPATLPFFLPGPPPIGSFGAVIRIRGAIPHRRALFDVAAAGPIAGFVVAIPVLAVGLHRARPVADAAVEAGGQLGSPLLLEAIHRVLVDQPNLEVNGWIGAGWVGLLVTSLNLFPVGQLDGGHAAYALSRRLHRAVSRATLVAFAGLLLAQAWLYRQLPAYFVWFAILAWMRDRHPALVDESEPLSVGRKIVAVVLLAIFVLSFMPVPLWL